MKAEDVDGFRELLLDQLWDAMSLAAKREDIPMQAQVKADEIASTLDKIIAQLTSNTSECPQSADQ